MAAILVHPYRILIIGGTRSRKTNAVSDFKNYQLDINEIYLYVKHPYYPKYQLLISKPKQIVTNHFKDAKVLIGYLIDIKDVHPDIDN